MNALEVAVRVAAAWRITKLIVDDEVTRELREKVAEVAPGSKLEYLVNCPACVSVWAGVAAFAMPRRAAGSLAASAGTLGVKWVAEQIEMTVSAKVNA